MFSVVTCLSAGKYLRQKRIDFQLPYDILWLWKHDQVNNHTVILCNCFRFILYFLGVGWFAASTENGK